MSILPECAGMKPPFTYSPRDREPPQFDLGPLFSGGPLEAGVIALIAVVFTVVIIFVR